MNTFFGRVHWVVFCPLNSWIRSPIVSLDVNGNKHLGQILAEQRPEDNARKGERIMDTQERFISQAAYNGARLGMPEIDEEESLL